MKNFYKMVLTASRIDQTIIFRSASENHFEDDKNKFQVCVYWHFAKVGLQTLPSSALMSSWLLFSLVHLTTFELCY